MNRTILVASSSCQTVKAANQHHSDFDVDNATAIGQCPPSLSDARNCSHASAATRGLGIKRENERMMGDEMGEK